MGRTNKCYCVVSQVPVKKARKRMVCFRLDLQNSKVDWYIYKYQVTLGCMYQVVTLAVSFKLIFLFIL
jgi:hypothetical protein